MNVTDVSSIITQLGFPIACTIGLAFAMWKIWNRQQDENCKREEKLYEVIVESQATNKQLSATNSEFVAVLSTYKDDLQEIKKDVVDIKQKLQ